ncbi:dienelactone hydrolase family protein [Arthrobacter sp. NPDC080073]|uniref:dienelactone hydrolase family protein n=1 Tax=Arthrobacter sp. NPDC080073 TaxID=3155919 RepID=UPI003427C91D
MQVDLSAQSAAAGGSRTLQCYLAKPAGTGPFPGLVLIHEGFGLDYIMRRHAHRLAVAGYLTLAVGVESDDSASGCLVSTMRSLASGTGRAFADIVTARSWLRRDDRCTGNVGVIGFCLGGGFALLGTTDGLDAASANYGDLPDELEDACPVLANYGHDDQTLPGAAAKLETVPIMLDLENEIREAARPAFINDVAVVPRSPIPLTRILGIKPNPAAAPKTWQRIEDHFAERLR